MTVTNHSLQTNQANETEPNSSSTQESTGAAVSLVSSEPKLLAGKYKSVDELEKAYNSSATVIREERSKREQLEKQFSVPEVYEMSNELPLRENEWQDIKALAKTARLTQDQFNTTAQEMSHRVMAQAQELADAKSAIGQEKINVLNDYVEKHYPQALRETVLNKIIKDGNAMNDALKHRDSLLNSTVPGVSQGSIGATESRYDGQSELTKAALQYQKQPNAANKERYINLAREVGEERFKK